MDVTTEYRRDEDTVWAKLSGVFSLAEAERTFVIVLDAVESNGAKKVVVDGRSVTGEPTIFERFFYGEFVAKKVAERNIQRRPKFAYVLQEPVLDKERLGQIVARNRGALVCAFDNLDDAKRWLEIS